jgi:hypothetical protein
MTRQSTFCMAGAGSGKNVGRDLSRARYERARLKFLQDLSRRAFLAVTESLSQALDEEIVKVGTVWVLLL